jgi:hypothetical protein
MPSSKTIEVPLAGTGITPLLPDAFKSTSKFPFVSVTLPCWFQSLMRV